MYNGIGISSVRGTATSGYVQSNRSHVRNNRVRHQRESNVSKRESVYNPVSTVARARGNKDILKHERLRRLENSLLEYRLDLEENRSDLKPEEIERRTQEERERRKKLMEMEETRTKQAGEKNAHFAFREHNNRDRGYGLYGINKNTDRSYQERKMDHGHTRQFGRDCRRRSNSNCLVDATRKEENDRLADAFGINKQNYVEGQAFDRELQEVKRRDRLEKKRRAEKDIEQASRKAGRETRREAKARRQELKEKWKKSPGKSSRRRKYVYRSSSDSSSSRSSSSRSFSSSSSSYSRSSMSSYLSDRSSKLSSSSSSSSSSSQESTGRSTIHRSRRNRDREGRRTTRKNIPPDRQRNSKGRRSKSRSHSISRSIDSGSVAIGSKFRPTKNITCVEKERVSEQNDKFKRQESGTKLNEKLEDKGKDQSSETPAICMSNSGHSKSNTSKLRREKRVSSAISGSRRPHEDRYQGKKKRR